MQMKLKRSWKSEELRQQSLVPKEKLTVSALGLQRVCNQLLL